MIESGPFLESHIPYDDAWLYCVTCTHDNKYDWRIPSLTEYLEYVHSIKRVIEFTQIQQNSFPWNEMSERCSPEYKFSNLRPVVPVRGSSYWYQ